MLALLLLADRVRYLVRFGFVYTDGDQVTFWNQAADIARGIVREPCLYGQSYNVPVESWLAAPLILAGAPAYVALPVVSTSLALLPFLWLVYVANRRGCPWAGMMVLLIPLALPVEYLVVSSLPRGFVNGIAVAMPAVVLWEGYQSRKAFFLAGFFAVLALVVNPSAAIVLLAVGVYALLAHLWQIRFYLFSILGGLAAAPAQLLIALFYRWHPQSDFYHPRLGMQFRWETVRGILISSDGKWAINHDLLDLFFADFSPILHRGWTMLIVLATLPLMLLAVRQMRGAYAVGLAAVFAIACVGFDRLHSATGNVFYSGSRMYLALPVLVALALIWFDTGLARVLESRLRFLVPALRFILIAGLAVLALTRDLKPLDAPSPFVEQSFLPPVESVAELRSDSRVLAHLCRKYDVSLVLICDNHCSSLDEGGPVLERDAFETLYPPFERRTWRITEEKTALHTRALVYLPSLFQNVLARESFAKVTTVSETPRVLLVETGPVAKTGMQMAAALGLIYRAKI